MFKALFSAAVGWEALAPGFRRIMQRESSDSLSTEQCTDTGAVQLDCGSACTGYLMARMQTPPTPLLAFQLAERLFTFNAFSVKICLKCKNISA